MGAPSILIKRLTLLRSCSFNLLIDSPGILMTMDGVMLLLVLFNLIPRMLKCSWTKPRNRLCMASITTKQDVLKYGRQNNSDHHIPELWTVSFLSFSSAA